MFRLNWATLLTAIAMILASLPLTTGTASAQTSDEMRTLVRSSGVEGIPDIRIDLTRPAEQKYAIVIGNGNYKYITNLKNTIADAKLVANYLRGAGYTVKELIDLDKEGFEAAMRSVLFDVAEGAEVVFYYAGHGLQIGSVNYIIPTDANLDTVYDLPFEAVSLKSILEIVGSRARASVMILDSCRTNPFTGKQAIVGLDSTPSITETGFTPQNTPVNSLLVFSTSPGAVAFDGDGPNSPFTTAFVDVLSSSPDQPVDSLMKRVRRIVYENTGGLQVPWDSSSLVEPIILASAVLPTDGGVRNDAVPVATPLALAANDTARSTATGAVSEGPIKITVPLEPTILIGPQILTALNMSENSSISVAQQPQSGLLELSGFSQSRGLSLVPMGPAAIGQILYRRATDQKPAADIEDMTVRDSFELVVNGAARKVEVEMQVDACDYQAGDYLDPDGVGIARYPNELEPQAALEACLAAVKRSPETARFHYQLGRAYVALRDSKAAQAEFEIARDLGHVRALNALGRIEDAKVQATGGSEGTKSSEAALAYFAAGVERGDPYAFHSLGRQLLLNAETDGERKYGFELLLRSLELGHTFSMNTLGFYFLDESSNHYDPERGLRFLRESAKREDIYGYNNMGYVAVNGAGGTKKDLDAALGWFRKAAAEGHPTAPSSIGRMYTNGEIGGNIDYAQAIYWYDIGLERGDAWGGSNAAWIIANKRPQGYKPSDSAVRAAKAASLRNAAAGDAAMDVLRNLPKSALDAGAQKLLNQLGERISVDGDFGAGSKAALGRVAKKYGRTIPNDRIDRLTALAKIFWETSKFRVDLY